MGAALLALLALSLCTNPLWTRRAVRPADADLSCYTDGNGTVWCADDVRLLEDVDPDDSY